jgi:AcrR family transcriptional regulator
VVAAEQLIDRHGPRSTQFTVRAIANAAGTSIGTIYHYFPDANAIIAAVAERFMEEVLQETEQATSGAKTWTEYVSGSEEAFLTIFRRRPGLRDLWFDNRGPPAVVDIHRYYHRLLAERSQRMIEETTGERLDLAIYMVLITMVGSLFELAFRADPQGDPLVLRELHHVQMAYYASHLSANTGDA